ncbi:MAG: c-type cytochrome [Alphaproteobacteria bacterium]|nr:c-type cytochrome [Alphaproteobacteria bacterium]
MRKSKLTTGLIALCGAIGLHSGIAQAEMTEAGKKAMQAAGQIMFQQRCESCHAADPARKAYGPSLLGVIGRKAGTLEGFEYSDAMKKSGIVWNENTLRAWIADNDGFMPGTRMRHVGIDDKAEQDFLLSYIKTLTAK